MAPAQLKALLLFATAAGGAATPRAPEDTTLLQVDMHNAQTPWATSAARANAQLDRLEQGYAELRQEIDATKGSGMQGKLAADVRGQVANLVDTYGTTGADRGGAYQAQEQNQAFPANKRGFDEREYTLLWEALAYIRKESGFSQTLRNCVYPQYDTTFSGSSWQRRGTLTCFDKRDDPRGHIVGLGNDNTCPSGSYSQQKYFSYYGWAVGASWTGSYKGVVCLTPGASAGWNPFDMNTYKNLYKKGHWDSSDGEGENWPTSWTWPIPGLGSSILGLAFPNVGVTNGLPSSASAYISQMSQGAFKHAQTQSQRSGTPVHVFYRGAGGSSSFNPNTITILASHGNGYTDFMAASPDQFPSMADAIAANLVLYEYPGYGVNSYSWQGTIEKAEVFSAVQAAWIYAVETLRVPPQNILLMSHSVGGAPTYELAANLYGTHTPRGVVTSAAFKGLVGALGVPLGTADALLNKYKISAVRAPIFLVHGEGDPVVKPTNMQGLYDRIVSPQFDINQGVVPQSACGTTCQYEDEGGTHNVALSPGLMGPVWTNLRNFLSQKCGVR